MVLVREKMGLGRSGRGELGKDGDAAWLIWEGVNLVKVVGKVLWCAKTLVVSEGDVVRVDLAICESFVASENFVRCEQFVARGNFVACGNFVIEKSLCRVNAP